MLKDALKSAASLRDYLNDVEKAIKTRLEKGGGAINIMWGQELVKKAANVFADLSRNNGAVLVRLKGDGDEAKKD